MTAPFSSQNHRLMLQSLLENHDSCDPRAENSHVRYTSRCSGDELTFVKYQNRGKAMFFID